MKTLRSTPALIIIAAVATVATVALSNIEISLPAVFEAIVGLVAVGGVFGMLLGDTAKSHSYCA